MDKQEENRFVILFDGVCNLCNGAVNLIIDHDPRGKFAFAPLQSEQAETILEKFNLTTQDFDSIVLIKNDQIFFKSRAALEIARDLEGFYPFLYIFKFVPRFISDFIYDIIAKYRYKWFGRREICRVPTPDIANRFLAGL